jgi:hypothetical protein
LNNREFEAPFKGRFLVSGEEDAETGVADESEVFAFELGNRSTGCFVSQGAWRDDHRGEHGFYDLVVTSPMTFVLTLWLRNATNVFDKVKTRHTPIPSRILSHASHCLLLDVVAFYHRQEVRR